MKGIVGPTSDPCLAEVSYHRSLVAAVTLSGGSGASRTASSPSAPPPVLCSHTMTSMTYLMKELFPLYTVRDVVTGTGLNAAQIESFEEAIDVAGDMGGMGSMGAYSATGRGMVLVHTTVSPFANLAGGQVASSSSLYFKATLSSMSQRTLQLRPSQPATLGKTIDVAGIIITHALLQEVGLTDIVDALNREGIYVINVTTAWLCEDSAKQMQGLAGASSLSMKPPLRLLRDGPVVALGLEGPVHAFIRFKSFTSATASTSSFGHTTKTIWKLNNTIGSEDEWGVLASSSSRLAKSLYTACFLDIHGSQSIFTIKDDSLGLD